MIDIIVPVYGNAGLTRRCMESVLATTSVSDRELVVINDASPEPELIGYLYGLRDAGRITLLENERNLGFVASANLGMRLHADRDVLLLNSDTEVAGDWLQRMRACALSNTSTGTVTPFSNSATLASYPCISKENPLVLPVSEMQELVARANSGKRIEIPTGVGFCLYLTRRCLAATGDFNEAEFNRGYGEENDFCIRASGMGFMHYLCGDVFVSHSGGASFGDERNTLVARAQETLERLHPGYAKKIADFLRDDPLRPMRRRIDLMRLALSPRHKVLLVTHAWGGGILRHVNDLVRLLTDDIEPLLLRPATGNVVQLIWARANEEFSACFRFPEERSKLIAVLKLTGVGRVHFHHLNGLPEGIRDIANLLEAPYDFTIHDYYTINRNYQLVDVHGHYAESILPRDMAWLDRNDTWLREAARVIAPAEDVARRMDGYFPGLKIEIMRHPEGDPRPTSGRRYLKVLVLGGLSEAKGLRMLEACAASAQKLDLPITFVLLGYAEKPVRQWPEIPLFIRGGYQEEHLEQAIAHENPNLIYFPAQWPETYSYTLSIALRTGVPIVAPRLGAFTERLRDYPDATLLEWDISPDECVVQLMHVGVGDRVQEQITFPQNPGTTLQTYRNWYLAAFPTATAARIPAAEDLNTISTSSAWYLSEVAVAVSDESSLEELFHAGVEQGYPEARQQLWRRLAEEPSRIEALQQNILFLQQHIRSLQEHNEELIRNYRTLTVEHEDQARLARSHIQHLENDLAMSRARAREFEESTSWQITLPLRWTMQQVKNTYRRLKRANYMFRHGMQQLPFVLHILRTEGVIAMFRRIQTRFSRAQTVVAPPNFVQYKLEESIAPLELCTSQQPIVSIVIPVYGQHLHTFSCLKSISEMSGDLAIEVIVLDDCSPEQAAGALAGVTGIRIVRNETNLGFLKSCNRGSREASGEYIVFLNNDTLVTEGWLEALLSVFRLHPDAGLAGAKLIYPDGRLQEAGGIVWRDGSAWNYGRGDDPGKPEYCYLREVDYCSGACIMVSRELFLAAGGFDEHFAPAYYEDTDLCFALRKAGKRIFYQPKAVIIHFEGVSHGTDESEGLKSHQVENRQKFYEKWQAALANHRSNGFAPDLERDRGVEKRLLYIDATIAMPDQDSGSVRVSRLLSAARVRGCKVTFIPDNLQYIEPYTGDLQDAGIEVQYYPYLKSIEEFLEAHGAEYDVIILARYYVAEKYVAAVRKYAPMALLVLDTVDLHYLRQRRLAEIEGGMNAVQAAEKTFAREIAVMRASDVTLVVSEAEKEILAEQLPEVTVRVLSNIHDVADHIKPFSERRGLMFVGGYRHPPNVDAVIWYANEVLPEIKRRLPGVKTFIIGSNPPQSIENLTDDALQIVGFVPDLTPYLQSCRVSISPLRYGAGVKGKINQAMSFGLPVVATTPSVEGMHLRDGIEVLVGDTPAAFADAVARIYNDETLWTRISAASRENVHVHFSEQVAGEVLHELFAIAEDCKQKRGKR
jgi:GT2 family glycosyltransferase